jgi:hypothetical protein
MNSIHQNAYTTQATNIPRVRHCQERSVPKFLKKIFSILEENRFNEYVSWSHDGTALVIKKPTDFAIKVLPLYFKHGNFSSFIRQLNMYKFKKSKNCEYDHIYTHQMFQQGRIDLLRNIQRKTSEIINLSPAESQSFKSDEDIDVERLIQENLHYKKLHKDLTTQVEFIETKMGDIKSEIARLQNEQSKSEANEKFLKNVLKNLTKAYGFENIAKIIENDAEEQNESPSMIQEVEMKSETFEAYSNVNNGSLSQAKSSYEEDGLFEKCSEYSPELESEEYYSTNDVPQPIERNQVPCSQFESCENKALFSLDFGFNVNFDDSNDNGFEFSPKLTKIDSFVIWIDELKNKEYNSEMLFSQTNKRFNGDILNVEDF